MTFDWIKAIVSPIFFFLCLMLTAMTLVALYTAFMHSTSFIVVSCLLFILALNAFRVGWGMMRRT